MTQEETKQTDPSVKAAETLSARRKGRAEQSILDFGKRYLGGYLSMPSSRLHREIYEILEDLEPYYSDDDLDAFGRRKPNIYREGILIGIAAPRGSAKSTIINLVYALWSICYKKEDYIILLSDSKDQSVALLKHIKDELESNIALRIDFYGVHGEPTGDDKRKWAHDEIETKNGVKITAMGTGGKLRGLRHRQTRPTLVICDDLENETHVKTSAQREALMDWFKKTVSNAGTTATHFFVIGTILHFDSLLSNLIDPDKNPKWKKIKYRSIIKEAENAALWEDWSGIYNNREEYNGSYGPQAARRFFENNRKPMLLGTEVLWSEKEPYEVLMEQKEDMGPGPFNSEKQNEPINPKDCLFQEEDLHFWDELGISEHVLISSLEGEFRMFGACDPSMGKKGGDFTAIITLLHHVKTGILYVLDADIERLVPDKIIDKIIECQRSRGYTAFGVEVNQFQEFLADTLEKTSRSLDPPVYIPIRHFRSATDKIARIQSIQPQVKRGVVQFSKRHRNLIKQLTEFPKGANDDGPDALHMAVTMVQEGGEPRIRVLETG